MKGIKWLGSLTRMFAPRPSPHIARGMFKRGFEAARLDRYSAGFLATEVSINQELRGDLNRLRMRGRGLVKNNDFAKNFRGLLEDNIVGPFGFTRQSRIVDPINGAEDRAANEAVEAGFKEWVGVADVKRRRDFHSMLRTAVGGLAADGEFLIREVMGEAAGNKFNYALQLIDVDRIDTQFHRAASASQNAVVMGVEIDAYRRPVALHLFAGHPNDGENSSRKRERVDMAELIHFFRIEYEDQVRGIPWLAPAMLALHHLGGFTMSALLAAEHGANHFGFFEQSPEGQGPNMGQEDPTTNEQISTSVPGIYDTLPHGVKFQPHESRFPDAAVGPFVKTLGQRIASGLRVPYHALFSDLEGVNFTSSRTGELAVRERWKVDQEEIIGAVLTRINRNWLRMALLSGALTFPNGNKLPATKFEKFVRTEWYGRRWAMVDPKTDFEAIILAVTAGLMTPQEGAASLGGDFNDNVRRIGEAMKLAKDEGAVLTAYLPKTTAAPVAPAPSGASAQPAE